LIDNYTGVWFDSFKQKELRIVTKFLGFGSILVGFSGAEITPSLTNIFLAAADFASFKFSLLTEI